MELIKRKYIPVYGVLLYSLTLAAAISLDFTVIHFLMKLFKSANMDISDCVLHFKFSLPSELIANFPTGWEN